MPRRPTFQISLYLTNRPVLVVGSGPIADNRADTLQRAGATLTRVADHAYEPGLCADKFLVLATGEDHSLNARIVADARAVGCLCYAHDQPELSDFASPALAERGPLTLAISTQSVAPALSRVIRQQLDKLLASGGEALDELLAKLETLRDQLPPGQRGAPLSALAARLRIDGRIHIDGEET